ncbi:MAG: biopolymer transporter ExbD [Spirochaetota bacterium]
MNKRSGFNHLLDRGPMLTPLIDIMFLVLIFFMVNNNPAQRSLEVRPPSMPQAPFQPGGSVLLLAVRPDLSYHIQFQKDSRILQEWHSPKAAAEIPEPGLANMLENLEKELLALESSRQIFSQIQRIRLRADQSLDYGSVIAICNLLYRWELPLDLDVRAESPRS